jgi:hypothetical protein
MTPTDAIYNIKLSKEFTGIWTDLTREEKEEVLRRLASQEAIDIEKVLKEIKTGQNRLF